MGRTLADVFQTMLSIEARFSGEVGNQPPSDRVSGSLGFGGEAVTGAVYLHLPPEFADHCARSMLGLPAEGPASVTDVNDVVGEVTNMLGGAFKSWLSDEGMQCAMSTPAIIRGRSFEIEVAEDVERIWLAFECGATRIFFEIHIHFT